jgi:esterase/lipase superfamily enzyme
VLAYGYDHESANYSRDALESVLQSLARDPQVGEISILAHSMGNWLTMEALRQMAIRDGHVAPKIKNLMLAAPDVDVDVFKRQLADIGPNSVQVTLFVSQDDRALALSARVWGGAPRLGAINPELEPNRSDLAADRIAVVDLTKLRAGGGLNHAKFAESADVVSLIGQRLIEGQTITESRTGVSDRIIEVTTNAATTVGSAAGLVLAAPTIFVDPNSRASYGEHLQSVGNALVDTAQSGARILPFANR